MKLKVFTFYLVEYLCTFPVNILHELSHWLFALPLWIVNKITFPKLVIDRYYSIKINSDYTVSQVSNSMSIQFKTDKERPLIVAYIASAPVFLIITIFWLCPFWLYPFIIVNIPSLFLSVTDIKQIEIAYNKLLKKPEKNN